MERVPISVTLITLNEEKHIARALESVKWADEAVVVDCGSNDRTCEIAQSLGAKVFQNPWKGYGQQKNFAQQKAQHDWVLNIDADEWVSDELALEIQTVLRSAGRSPHSTPQAFEIPRLSHYLGRWIKKGGWYPNSLVRLAHRGNARWTEPAVHEALVVQGQVGSLRSPLLHTPFESLEDQIQANLRYSREGYRQLRSRGKSGSLPLLILKPLSKFIETFVIKRGFLDGIPGFIISVNAAHSVFLKYAYFFEPEGKSDEDFSHR